MAVTTTKLMTAEELAALPDDGYQYELVRGVLVKMPPPGFEHGEIVGETFGWLREFVRAHGLGRVVTADAGFRLEEDPDTVRGPDIAFVRADRLPPPDQRVGYLAIPPDLVVEVVSRSQSEGDVATKVADYLRAGVPLVWTVFPRRRGVAIHRAGRAPQELAIGDELDGEDVLPGFRLPVAAIFRDLL